jgi:hypothetical protein
MNCVLTVCWTWKAPRSVQTTHRYRIVRGLRSEVSSIWTINPEHEQLSQTQGSSEEPSSERRGLPLLSAREDRRASPVVDIRRRTLSSPSWYRRWL